MRYGTPHLPSCSVQFHIRGRRPHHGSEDHKLESQAISKWCVSFLHPYLLLSTIVGVFFIFGAGRLSLAQSQPQKAIEYYTRAMEVQKQYRNLHHISFWEIALANLSLWDLEASLVCWRDLEREATVSLNTPRLPYCTYIRFAVVQSHILIRNGHLPSRWSTN